MRNAGYRTLKCKKEDRPQFEKMMSDLSRAMDYWDHPNLRDYSRVLLTLVGRIALTEAGSVVTETVWDTLNVEPATKDIDQVALLPDHA